VVSEVPQRLRRLLWLLIGALEHDDCDGNAGAIPGTDLDC
jgi:hypothetical protein